MPAASSTNPAFGNPKPSSECGEDKQDDNLATSSLPRLHKTPVLTSPIQQIPWRYRITAGLMIMLFAFGSSLSETTLGPLKSTLRRELDITSELSSEFRLIPS